MLRRGKDGQRNVARMVDLVIVFLMHLQGTVWFVLVSLMLI